MQICSKSKTSIFNISFKKNFQTRFINRYNPFFHFINFSGININTNNFITSFSKTCSGNKSYISSTNYRYFQYFLLIIF